MKRLLYFLIGVLFSVTMHSQQKRLEKPMPSDKNPNNRLFQYNADFALGVNAEQSAQGVADIPMMKDAAVRLERFYTKFGNQEQFSTGFAIKYFLSEEFYLINGTEIQFDINEKTGAPQRELIRLNFGMGYRVDPKLLLELGYKPRIGNPNLAVLESVISNRESTFFLKARF